LDIPPNIYRMVMEVPTVAGGGAWRDIVPDPPAAVPNRPISARRDGEGVHVLAHGEEEPPRPEASAGAPPAHPAGGRGVPRHWSTS
jgi:hypothetical protein